MGIANQRVGRKRTWDTDLAKQVIALRDNPNNMSIVKIGEELGIHPSKVQRILEKENYRPIETRIILGLNNALGSLTGYPDALRAAQQAMLATLDEDEISHFTELVTNA